MIKLTLFDNTGITVNAELIEFVEETPDTVISLTSGRKFTVKETADEVVGRTVDYKKQFMMNGLRLEHVSADRNVPIRKTER